MAEGAEFEAVRRAREELDRHAREIVRWHLSTETGTPLWIDLARERGVRAEDVGGFEDLHLLPRFDEAWLRDLPHERLVPRAFAGRPYSVFETGGTTGRPKQRLSWEDHLVDYAWLAGRLPDEDFPRGAAWLSVGPTGPRRLRVGIEHLANLRGGPCFLVDLDPRWARRLQTEGRTDELRRYREHVVEQALRVLGRRPIACLFTTPPLLEALGEAASLPDLGVRGVLLGGTSLSPQSLRFAAEEVLEGRAAIVPIYGNTLMGLALAEPVGPAQAWEPIYHAPEPRAVLRIVDPDAPDVEVSYGTLGRVELTTLTRELLLPRFLERDEAIRRPPGGGFAWDGAGDVRPFRRLPDASVEGVY